jgi:dolichyl-phosphate-mannose--protein O-mannosyl transferase
MNQRTFQLTAGVVFLLIAIGHLLRIVSRGEFIVQGVAIPMWASVVAVIIMGYLAFESFRLGRKSEPRH